MKNLCWLFETELCNVIKMMDVLCSNLYFSDRLKYVYSTQS
jgi:hypothetical protein